MRAYSRCRPLAHAREHARLDVLRGAPVALVGDVLERMPELRIAQPVAPLAPELAVEEIRPALVQEGRHVHAVGDETNRIVLGPQLRPLIRAQARRDRAMDAAYAVHVARALERQARHVEHSRRGRCTAELEEALDTQSQLADEVSEVSDHQLRPEGVVTGRDRRMGREHATRRHRFQRRIKPEPLGQVLAQQLEDEKRRVTLVQVPNGRLHAEGPQRAHAADAEDHFLAHAGGFIAAVKPVGNVPIGRRVFLAVGIEQVHRHAPDLRLPDARHDLAPGDAHRHLEPLAARVTRRFHRQVARIPLAILRLLDAVVVDRLGEVALLVEQSHGDEIRALIARRLAVVPGEHPEATGVDGEALVEAVLGAEISDQRLLCRRCAHADVCIQRVQFLLVAAEVGLVPGAALEVALIHAAQHEARVAAGLLPQLRIQILEQGAGRPMPTEKKVAGQLRQARQARRDYGGNFEERVSH